MTNLQYSSYFPGCLSSLCALQSVYYSREWGFDHKYELAVSESISEFLSRYKEGKHFIQVVLDGDVVKGGIVIDRLSENLGILHWFILHSDLRGSGTGAKLLSNAMDFVNQFSISRVELSTFDGLHSARHLYEKFGFMLSEEKEQATWGKLVVEQKFIWTNGC